MSMSADLQTRLQTVPKGSPELSPSDIDKIVRAIGGNLRLKAMFALTLGCGMRSVEVASLRWADVLTASGDVGDAVTIRVSKTARGRRNFFLVPKVREVLAAWHRASKFKARTDPIFAQDRDLPDYTYTRKSDGCVIHVEGVMAGTPTSPNAIAKALGDLYRFAGVHASSHAGRKTLARQSALAGAGEQGLCDAFGWEDTRSARAYLRGLGRDWPAIEKAANKVCRW